MINSSAMKLYYQHFPDHLSIDQFAHNVPVIIIHGLFGSTANWRSFARKLAVTRPVIVVDLRNHGRSPHADSNTYVDMVADLIELCDQLAIDKAVFCGHSMGGKVGMLLAHKHPQRVERLLVLDIAPVKYQHSHAPFLQGLMNIDLSVLKSRSEADRALRNVITDTPTRLFLLQSLTGSPGNYKWRINIPVLYEFMETIMDFPEQTTRFDAPTLFLHGELSNYVLQEHRAKIEQMFSHPQFQSIEGAGHWLHAEQPDLVLLAVREFIDS